MDSAPGASWVKRLRNLPALSQKQTHLALSKVRWGTHTGTEHRVCLKEQDQRTRDSLHHLQTEVWAQRPWISCTAGGSSWPSTCRLDTAATRACSIWPPPWLIFIPPSSGCSQCGSTCRKTLGSGSSGWLLLETG